MPSSRDSLDDTQEYHPPVFLPHCKESKAYHFSLYLLTHPLFFSVKLPLPSIIFYQSYTTGDPYPQGPEGYLHIKVILQVFIE